MITALLLIVFFANERFFYGNSICLCLHVATCSLLCIQLFVSLFYGIYNIKKQTISIRGLGVLSIIFTCIGIGLVYGGGILNTDTGRLRDTSSDYSYYILNDPRNPLTA